MQHKIIMLLHWILLGAMLLQQMKISVAVKSKGDACLSKGAGGICREWSECSIIKTLIERGEYTNSEVVSCGLGIKEELICCPNSDDKEETTTVQNINHFENSNTSPQPDISKDRPAVRACRRIEEGLTASLTKHILGGTRVEKGEFPHMVAIGYSRIAGDDSSPYEILCGGTLIDKRFALTAAHCVSESGNIPVIVRLGVVNFTDPVEMSTAVELKIKKIHIHHDYSHRYIYNDIAILELEHDVDYNEYIYPVCLYINETDPDTNVKLWVIGWGTVNTRTHISSNFLLKAPLNISPLENCNKSFIEYGLTRRIPEGIKRTQLCAIDKDQIKDTCQGDSGGPLNLIVDESSKNYRLVGIVSAGFGCATSIPGLYTRVAAFLDFIEKIVWPNGGD